MRYVDLYELSLTKHIFIAIFERHILTMLDRNTKTPRNITLTTSLKQTSTNHVSTMSTATLLLHS